MLDAELLALLVCPETHQDVRQSTADELARLNEAIARREVRTRAGELVTQPLQEALLRVDQAVAYPIRNGIPVMLVAEGLAVQQVPLSPEAKT